jgi:hypothetical protein
MIGIMWNQIGELYVTLQTFPARCIGYDCINGTRRIGN